MGAEAGAETTLTEEAQVIEEVAKEIKIRGLIKNTLLKTQGIKPPVTPTYLPGVCASATGPMESRVFVAWNRQHVNGRILFKPHLRIEVSTSSDNRKIVRKKFTVCYTMVPSRKYR